MIVAENDNVESAGYELYIMRHGIAVGRGSGASVDDASRRLTPEGRRKMEAVAKGLKRLGLAVDWIVTSPYVRAAETAQIVADSLGQKAPLDFCDAMRPGETSEKLLSFLAKQPGRRRILLVGHEPDLSTLAARLIGAGRSANIEFKKGGCCLIEGDANFPKSQGRLVWWLTPRLLRAMG